jgi:hypothetical protein
MAIIGFIFLFIVGLFGTGFYFLICTQTLPQYNIGGVPTKWYGKVATILLGIAIYYGWKLIFEYSPFLITLT